MLFTSGRFLCLGGYKQVWRWMARLWGRGGEVLPPGRGARGVLTPVVYMGEGSSVGVVPAFWKGVEEQ